MMIEREQSLTIEESETTETTKPNRAKLYKRYDLIPRFAIGWLARAMAYGALKRNLPEEQEREWLQTYPIIGDEAPYNHVLHHLEQVAESRPGSMRRIWAWAKVLANASMAIELELRNSFQNMRVIDEWENEILFKLPTVQKDLTLKKPNEKGDA